MATSDLPISKKWYLPFFTIWGGQALSLLGSQLVQFALVWWLTKTTGSATVLATATLVALLPPVLIGPLAGAVVDRWSRRWVMIIADGLTALGVVGLALLFWSGQVQVWHVYVLMFLRAVSGSFHWPAMQASTSLMVPGEHLARVQGLNQMLNGLMNIGAAPLGALLLGLLPMQSVLAIDVVTALIAILPLLFIAIPQPERKAQPAGQEPETGGAARQAASGLVGDLKEGLRYVLGWPGLMLILLMATLINLMLTPMGALQPLLVSSYFGGEAFQLAILEVAWGVGMVAGGLTLSAWGGFKRRILTTLTALILMGLSIAAVGLVPAWAFWLAVGLMFLVGFFNPIVNGPLMAVVQAVVAPEMQGRVFTLINSFAMAMTPIGLILAGPLADRFGVIVWYLVGGIFTMLLGGAALFVPAIMNIESDRRPADASDQPAAAGADIAPAALEATGD